MRSLEAPASLEVFNTGVINESMISAVDQDIVKNLSSFQNL